MGCGGTGGALKGSKALGCGSFSSIISQKVLLQWMPIWILGERCTLDLFVLTRNSLKFPLACVTPESRHRPRVHILFVQ